MTPVTRIYTAMSHLPVNICGSDGKELCRVKCKHLGAVLPSGWASLCRALHSEPHQNSLCISWSSCDQVLDISVCDEWCDGKSAEIQATEPVAAWYNGSASREPVSILLSSLAGIACVVAAAKPVCPCTLVSGPAPQRLRSCRYQRKAKAETAWQANPHPTQAMRSHHRGILVR